MLYITGQSALYYTWYLYRVPYIPDKLRVLPDRVRRMNLLYTRYVHDEYSTELVSTIYGGKVISQYILYIRIV